MPRDFTFIDLGAAPGGFAAFLLACSQKARLGYAYTLPTKESGIAFRLANPRVKLCECDVFCLPMIHGIPNVNLVVADAQYISADEKFAQGGGELAPTATCFLSVCGPWALTCRLCSLAIQKVCSGTSGGVVISRFDSRVATMSWNSPESGVDLTRVENFRRILFFRILGLIWDLFSSVEVFKSDTGNGACYVIGQGFLGTESQRRQACMLLRGAESNLRAEKRLDVLMRLNLLAEVRVSPSVSRQIESALSRILEPPCAVHSDNVPIQRPPSAHL